MPKLSAGVLLYRLNKGQIEVLLVHPGGPYWRGKNEGAWSIPKGEYDQGEDALAAALREFEEETGSAISGEFNPLTPVKQPGGKIVSAWAVEGGFDPSTLRSNTFTLEWPPRSGRIHEFPEVDRAQWFSIDEAERMMSKGQLPLLRQLGRILGKPSDS